jgi:endonuclease III
VKGMLKLASCTNSTSQRTRDPVAVKATRRLSARYHNATELASADESKVRGWIKPATYHEARAKGMIETSKQIV